MRRIDNFSTLFRLVPSCGRELPYQNHRPNLRNQSDAMKKHNSITAVTISSLVFSVAASNAATVVSSSNEFAPATQSSFTPSYTVPSGNVLAGLTPTTATGSFTLESSGGTSVLTDGTFGTLGGASPRQPTAPSHPRDLRWREQLGHIVDLQFFRHPAFLADRDGRLE